MNYRFNYNLILIILLLILLLILLKFISLKKSTIQYFSQNVKSKKGIIGDFSHFKNSKLYKLMKNDFEVYNKNNNYNLLLMWEPFERVIKPKTNITNILNKNLKDISKKGLEKLHLKIFGYNLIVDPTTYNDKFISKANGSNKLGSVQNPHYKLYSNKLKPNEVKKDFIYQKYINNRDDKNNIVDYRVFIFKKQVKYVIKYLVTKPFLTRLGTSKQKSFVEYKKYFKKSNIIKINQFINELDLEYGEIDIIIDKNTKNLYIIDVNNTPSGSYSMFSLSQVNDIKKYFD